MKKNKHEFTGIFVPTQILKSKELTSSEKLILGEIEALSLQTGWCRAGRDHFAEWLFCTPENVTYYTKRLEEMGFLEICRTPGVASKMRVVKDRFYTDSAIESNKSSKRSSGVGNNRSLPVSSKHNLTKVVFPVYGSSKPDSPEIKEKYKDKILPPNPQFSENENPAKVGRLTNPKPFVGFALVNGVESYGNKADGNENHAEGSFQLNQDMPNFLTHAGGQIDPYAAASENGVEVKEKLVNENDGELTDAELNYLFGCSDNDAGTVEPNTGKQIVFTPRGDAQAQAQSAPATEKAAENTGEYTFEEFWKDYDFKRGSKAQAKARFLKLSKKDKEMIKEVLPVYLAETSTTGEEKGAAFKPMRKQAEFFLSPKAKIWETLVERAEQLKNAPPPIRKPFHETTHDQYTAYYGGLYEGITLLTADEWRQIKYGVFHENEKDFTRQEWLDLLEQSHHICKSLKIPIYTAVTNKIKLLGERKKGY